MKQPLHGATDLPASRQTIALGRATGFSLVVADYAVTYVLRAELTS
jgi:hypothetical protein